jgi:3-hydroxybutyryl-CoA dehydrogenase
MNISIIGAGSMGSGIAQVAATADCKVKIFDTNPAVLETADKKLRKILARLVEKGRIDEAKQNSILNNIKYITDLKEIADANLVIEAIIENLEIKKTVFKNIENIVSKYCILASNTSSLSIASIAAACEVPERVVGIHFFNPAPLMKLVEIIPAIQTADVVLEQAKSIIDSWGKLTVLVKDTPGFIVNRVARPFYGEALRILEENVADAATIDWAMTELGGFRMGPFTLMDYIGHDVNYTVTETVFKAFYYDERYKPSFTQKRLAEAGYLGRKTGKGFYDYSENAVKPEPNKDENLGKYIVNRIVMMLINEAADALFLNVATRDDIDTAMTKGVNYPKGLLKWADELGIATVVSRLDALFDDYRESRYRCSPLLRRMARNKVTFY